MSGFFTNASTTYLLNNSPPFTAAPFSLGMWLYPITTGVVMEWYSLCNSGTTTNSFFGGIGTAAPQQWFWGANGGAADRIASISSVDFNAWTFVLAREIAGNNRRISIFRGATAQVEHANNTQNAVPSGVNREAIGAFGPSSGFTNGFGGYIAEFWQANIDVYPTAGGGAASNDFVASLALNGPFAFPSIIPNITQYHSFRHHLSSDRFTNEDDFLQIGFPGLETLTNNNGVILGPHVPLPLQYRGPKDIYKPYNLAAILAGNVVAPSLFSGGRIWRNRLMMVGQGP